MAREAPPAGAKTNLTDEQDQHLFSKNLGKYERLLAAKKAADKAFLDHTKVMKSDHGDYAQDMVKTALALRDAEKSRIAKERANAVLKVMVWNGEKTVVQGDLFGDAPDEAMTVEERAYAAGRRAGIKGDAMSAPVEYAAGDAFQEWAKGWHAGQDAIFAIKAPTGDKLN